MSQVYSLQVRGGNGGPGSVRRSWSTQLTANVSTTATEPVWTNILTLPVVTTGGDLLLQYTMAGSTVASTLGMISRMMLDAVLVKGTAQSGRGAFFILSAACQAKVLGVAAGPHLITVDIAKTALDLPATQIQIIAASLPNRQHATLHVWELEP